MVLELIIIGGVIFYYVKKNKQARARKAALAAGQPWINKDGSITYPPNYSSLPPSYVPGDYKQQVPVEVQDREQEVPVTVSSRSEKTPVVVETREIVSPVSEKTPLKN